MQKEQKAFWIASAALTILLPALSFGYGITWDEKVLSDYAKDVLAYIFSFGNDQSVFDMGKHAQNATIHYGASFDVFAQWFYQNLSPFGLYETRHLLNSLAGAWCMVFAGLLAKELGGWKTGLLALLLAVLSPRLFGDSMNNPKDIPFALAYAMSAYFMLRYFFRESGQTKNALGFALSAALLISLKIGGLIVLCLFGLFCVLDVLKKFPYKKEKGFFWKEKILFHLKTAAWVFPLSYFLGILFWPYGISAPFSNPFVSLSNFSDFGFLTIYELFDGERMLMSDPPARYIPQWVLISVPIAVLLALPFSLSVFIKKEAGPEETVIQQKIFLLWICILIPWLYAVIKSSTLYSGWRHFYFIYPPLLALAAYSWGAFIFAQAKKAYRIGVAALLLVLLLRPAFWMMQNHPYQHLYFNELSKGFEGAWGWYETEYWGSPLKQATEWLGANALQDGRKIKVQTNFELTSGQYYADKNAWPMEFLWTRENIRHREYWDYFIVGSRGMSAEEIESSFPPKGTIHRIEVEGKTVLAIVKRENDFMQQAYTLREAGKHAEALALAKKAIAYNASEGEYMRMAAICHLKLRQTDSAALYVQQALAINPQDYTAWAILGEAFNLAGQFEQGIEACSRSVSFKTNNMNAFHQRAKAYSSLKNHALAYADFEEAVRLSLGQNPTVLHDAAIGALMLAAEDRASAPELSEKAIRYLQKAIELNPKFTSAYKNLIMLLEKTGDREKADFYRREMMK